jgi:hypothetical protein
MLGVYACLSVAHRWVRREVLFNPLVELDGMGLFYPKSKNNALKFGFCVEDMPNCSTVSAWS